MTVQKSTIKKSFFGVHYSNKIKENKKLLIVITILQMMGYPLFVLSRLMKENEKGGMLVAMFAFAVAALSGIVVVLSCYKYLYNKSMTDMNMALPLTSKQRFFSEYLAGLTIYAAPAIAGGIIGAIILFAEEQLHIRTFDMPTQNYWLYALIILTGMVMFYTLIVMTTTCCGTMFSSVISAGMINILIPAIFYTMEVCVSNAQCFGISGRETFNQELYGTSPLGNAVFLFNYVDNAMYPVDNIAFGQAVYIRWFITSAAVIAAALLGGYLLFKHRKSEEVSTPYVYKTFYYTAVTLSVLCAVLLMVVNNSGYLVAFGICGIVYLIMEVISNRGFRKFWKSIIRFGATGVLVFLIALTVKRTECFGISKYVPDSSAVRSASVTFSSKYYDHAYDSPRYTYSRKDIIEKIIELQRKKIDFHYNENSKEKYIKENEIIKADNISTARIENEESVEIAYELSSGRIVERKYSCGEDEIYDLFEEIKCTDKYADTEAENLMAVTLNTINAKNREEAIKKQSDIKLDIYNNIDTIASDYLTLDYDELDELCEAYRADLKQMTPQSYKTSRPILWLYKPLEFEIRDNFKNTLEFLEKHGIKIGKAQEISMNNTSQIWLYTDAIEYGGLKGKKTKETIPKYYMYSKYTVMDTSDGGNMPSIRMDHLIPMSEAMGKGTSDILKALKQDNELEEILKVAQPEYNADSIGGVLIINNKVYMIPKEYKKQVEDVYNRYFAKLVLNKKVDEYGNAYYQDEYGDNVYSGMASTNNFYDKYGLYHYSLSGEKVYESKIANSEY